MTPRIPLIALTVATLAVALTGCADSTDETAQEPASAPTTTVEPGPAGTADPVVDAPVEETAPPESAPSCESIIAPSTVEALESYGWSYEEQEFRFGADVIEGGFQCVWGDYTVASDHVQIFGWAPMDAQAAVDAQENLLGEGWIRADSDGHVYITENPQFSLATDEDGFGMTYEFGDGWVTVADTRQSLVLITPPQI